MQQPPVPAEAATDAGFEAGSGEAEDRGLRRRRRVRVQVPAQCLPARVVAAAAASGGAATPDAEPSQRLRRAAAAQEEAAYQRLLGNSLASLSPTAPRSGGPSALREITPQLSLAVNILVSVLGTGAGVTWLTSKVVPDDLAVCLAVGMGAAVTLLLVETILLLTRMETLDKRGPTPPPP